MTLDEAIKHAEEAANREAENAEWFDLGDDSSEMFRTKCERCRERAEEHRQLAEWLKELKQLREQIKWIPVSERLPEDGRPVLIYAWNVHHVVARYDIFRTENGYKKCWVTADAWNGNTEIKHAVIAWMPMSTPYEERGDKK